MLVLILLSVLILLPVLVILVLLVLLVVLAAKYENRHQRCYYHQPKNRNDNLHFMANHVRTNSTENCTTSSTEESTTHLVTGESSSRTAKHC